jgi:glycosyltransferase involved in cell wall biosynthesis
MMRSKITQLMLTNGFGGAERHFVDLSLALADRGYQIQAICHSEFIRRQVLAAHTNIEVVPVKAWGYWDLWSARRIRKEIARFAPDVIHTHLARGAYLGGKAAAALGIPCVVNLHNYINLKYYRNIDTFIAATEDQKRYLLAQGVAECAVTVMPHFSLLAATPPSPLPEDRPIRFIALGRMVKKKGFDVLINAFKEYLQSGRDGRLIIGGDGPERDQLLSLATQPGLDHKIEFAGWVDDVAGFLSQGDVFVLPSRDEPFGIVVLEAMASGKPIISSRTQGPITILDDQTAYFTEIGNAATITQAMLDVARDKTGAMKKAAAASLLYQSAYCADAVVPQVEAIYRRVTGAGK